MSDQTKSSLDSGTLNSDRVDQDASRDQQMEKRSEDQQDAGEMRTGEGGDDAMNESGAGYGNNPVADDTGAGA